MTRKQYEQQRYFNRVQRAAARALDLATTMTFREMAADLFRCFKEVEEYRGHTPQYSAALLLAIVVIGLLSSENNVRNIETFIKNNPDKVKEYLKMAGINSKLGMPSDSTLLRALHHVDYLDLPQLSANGVIVGSPAVQNIVTSLLTVKHCVHASKNAFVEHTRLIYLMHLTLTADAFMPKSRLERRLTK